MKRTTKTMEGVHYGPEPTWETTFGSEKDQMDAVAAAMNWYHHMLSKSKAKKYLRDYMQTEGFEEPQIHNAVKAVEDFTGMHAAKLGRLKMLDAPLSDEQLGELNTLVEKAIEEGSRKRDARKPVDTDKRAETFENRLSGLLNEIEQQIDSLFVGVHQENQVPDFSMRGWATKHEIGARYASAIKDFFEPMLEELQSYDTDPQVKEAYAEYGKRKVNKIRKTIEAWIEDLEGSIKTKPRRKRKVNPIKATEKVQYMKSSSEYGISSVPPSQIVGANRVLLFNTKYRTLTLLDAGTEELSVRGTTVFGYDESKSVVKKLRKPKGSLKVVMGSGIREIRKHIDGLSTKPGRLTGRIGEDTLIVKVL